MRMCMYAYRYVIYIYAHIHTYAYPSSLVHSFRALKVDIAPWWTQLVPGGGGEGSLASLRHSVQGAVVTPQVGPRALGEGLWWWTEFEAQRLW